MNVYLIVAGDAGLKRGKVPAKYYKEAGSLTENARDRIFRDTVLMRKRGVKLDEIWHGPELNAKQTADIIAHELNVDDVFKKAFLRAGEAPEKCVNKLDGMGLSGIAIVSSRNYISGLSPALRALGGDITVKTDY